MTLPIRYRPEVGSDIREAFIWYQTQRPGLGWEFSLCVEEAIARLRESPEAYPIVFRYSRRAPVRRFPYGEFYRMGADHIMITAVLHANRDPSLWERRER